MNFFDIIEIQNFRRYLAGIIIFFFACSAALSAETVTLAADEWCPVNCKAGSKNEGIFIEIAREIFKQKGINVQYKVMPWSRAVSECRMGKFSAVVGAYKSDAPDFVFPKPIIDSGESIYVLNDSHWQYTGPESLTQISIGIIQDYGYYEEIAKYINQNITNSKRVQVASGENPVAVNIKKLFAKRIDALLENDIVIQYMLSKDNLKGRVRPAKSYPKQELFIAFSPADPNSKRYAEIFTEGLDAIKKNGIYDDIIARYHVL